MEIISSTSNKKLQFAKSLKDKKARAEFCMFLVEGETIVKSIPATVNIESIFVAKSKADKFAYITQDFVEKTYVVDDKVFETMCETKTPSGIVAIVKQDYEVAKNTSKVAVLDGISDAGNFGTIIRTCVACGISEIYSVNCVDAYCGKVVRSSMSGIFNVNVHQSSYEDIAEIAKEYQLISLDMNGESVFTVAPGGKFALVVGSEAHGLSNEIKQLCNKVVSIPMANQIESLNAGVAFSIAIYILSEKCVHTL